MYNRDNLAMLVAVGLSIGLHATILPAVYSNQNSLSTAEPNHDLPIDLPAVEDEIELGIDESETSTLTWIGYKDYKKHLARHAEVEQAEMSINNTSSITSIKNLALFSQPVMEMAEQFLEALGKLNITTPSRELPNNAPEEIVEIIVDETPVDPSEENQVAQVPGDRDSEATSVIRVSQKEWETGKPLAADGIVLRPVRPPLTALQRLSGYPGNLVASLHIDRRGIPADVVILLGTSSKSINRTIENCLYRWTASGKQIESLKEEETIEITIQILFGH
jgi:hypothetical protein